MMRTVTVRVPGDKSITHRALILASLADGESRIVAPLDAADTRSTRAVLEQLGTRIHQARDGLRVDGRGIDAWTAPAASLDCGNSGTTARLLMGGLAGRPFGAVLHGDASLQARPMTRVIVPLSAMGARFEALGAQGRLPVRVEGGALRGIDHLSAQSSAQVKSALLLAALTGDAAVRVTEPRLSRDHTERMLLAAGVPVVRSVVEGSPAVAIDGRHAIAPLDLVVPRDFSSAAFFVAAALLSRSTEVLLPGVGLNPGRTGMIDVLRRMHASVDVSAEREEAGEPVGDIGARPSALSAFALDGAEVPSLIDEIPVLAILAARAHGESRITGASELRVKETDRIRALVHNLRAVGVAAEELPDGMVIEGTTRALSGRIEAFGDHRIAMAFGVLGSQQGNTIEVDEPDVVAVSFPEFWEALADMGTAGAA